MNIRYCTAALALGLATLTAHAETFRLTSPHLHDGRPIDNKYVFKGFGCAGENVSPTFRWEHAPAGTKSFALMVHDPDAPTGGAGFWHWVVVDIPATATSFEEGAGTADGAKLPAGARQIGTDFGAPGWGGPCPPVGDKPHHYHATLYALKVDKLELPPNPTASLVGFVVNANAIGKAKTTGTYGRTK